MKFKQNLNQLTGTFNRLAAAIWIGASLLTACTPSTETVPVTTASSPAALSTVAFTPVLTSYSTSTGEPVNKADACADNHAQSTMPDVFNRNAARSSWGAGHAA